MLLEAIFRSLDLVSGACALLLLLLQLLWLRPRRHHVQADHECKRKTQRLEGLVYPPSIRAAIPWLGHIITYGKEGHEFFSNLCSSTASPIFTIKMLNTELSVVKPQLRQYLSKTRNLRTFPVVVNVFRQALDFRDHSCALLNENLPKSHGFATKISRIFREEFIPNLKMDRYIEQLDGYICENIDTLVAKGAGGAGVRVEAWVQSAVAGSLGRVLWGEKSEQVGPFSDPEFLSHLNSMLQNLRALSSPVSFVTDRKLLESRRFVREALERTAAEAEYPVDSLLGRLQEACRVHGADPEDWTDMQLLLVSGALPNIFGILTWMVHHLVAEPEWMAVVREEIQTYADSTEGDLGLSEISVACPKLSATWYEILRFHSGFSLARYVEEDTAFANKWRLKKGTNLLAPMRPYHVDKAVWGDDVDLFRPQRFLRADGRLDEVLKRKVQVFGLFGTMCPGRFLAANIAMLFTVRLLLSVDISSLDGKPHVVPSERDSLLGIPSPACDPEVLVKRRLEGRRDVRIRLRSINQESDVDLRSKA